MIFCGINFLSYLQDVAFHCFIFILFIDVITILLLSSCDNDQSRQQFVQKKSPMTWEMSLFILALTEAEAGIQA